MIMKIDLSIVIPVRKVSPHLSKCINSIFRSYRRVRNKEIEVIIASHKQNKINFQKLGFGSKVRLVTQSGKYLLGTSRARNLGILAAKGRILAFTDDDCVVDAEWISQIFHSFEKIKSQRRIVCVLGNHWLDQKYVFWSDLQEQYRKQHALEHLFKESKNIFTNRLDGRNFAILRKIALPFLFNENLLTEADRELGVRLIKNNHKIKFNPSMKVYHIPITLCDIIKKEFRYGIGSIKWRKKELNRTFFNYYLRNYFIKPLKEFFNNEISLKLLCFTLMNNVVYQTGRIYGSFKK